MQCKIKNKYRRKNIGLFSRLSLHKLLVHPEKTGRSIVVDHRDGNKLNNQKSNLRVCTHSENMRNRNPQISSSQYKGVYWNNRCKKWEVQISQNSRSLKLGTYTSEVAAANVYNHYAKKAFGDFSKLNDCEYMSPEECYTYKCGQNKSSKYRGVSLLSNGKYKSQVWDNQNKKNIQLGEFALESDAAKAYNEKAIEIFGSRAIINKIL